MLFLFFFVCIFNSSENKQTRMKSNDLKKSECEDEFDYHKKINQHEYLILKKNYNYILPNSSLLIKKKIKKSKEEGSEDPIETSSQLFSSSLRSIPVQFPTECEFVIENETMEMLKLFSSQESREDQEKTPHIHKSETMEMNSLISPQESSKYQEKTPHIHKINLLNNNPNEKPEFDPIEGTLSYKLNLKTTSDPEPKRNISKILEIISVDWSESKSSSPAINISIQNFEGEEHDLQDSLRFQKKQEGISMDYVDEEELICDDVDVETYTPQKRIKISSVDYSIKNTEPSNRNNSIQSSNDYMKEHIRKAKSFDGPSVSATTHISDHIMNDSEKQDCFFSKRETPRIHPEPQDKVLSKTIKMTQQEKNPIISSFYEKSPYQFSDKYYQLWVKKKYSSFLKKCMYQFLNKHSLLRVKDDYTQIGRAHV